MIKPYTWWARKAHYSLLKVIATALLRIINSWLFTWKFIVFCKPNGNLAPLSVFVVFDVQKIPLKSLSVKWSRHREQARINDLYLYDQCSLVSFFAQTTPRDEKKEGRKLHVTAVKMVVVLTETTKRDFTFHCGHSAKTNISFDSFMTRFVHAYYSSRMIDRFLNWYDHGKPKSAKVKGRGHPASPTLVVRIYTTLCLFGWILTHCNFLFRKYKTVNIKGLFAGYF